MAGDFGPADPNPPPVDDPLNTGKTHNGTFSVSGGAISAALSQIALDADKAYAALDKVAQGWAKIDAQTQKSNFKGAMGINDLNDECKRLGITMAELQQRMEPIGGVLQNFATSAQTLTGNLNGLASASGQANDALGQGIGFQEKATIINLQWTQATKEELDLLKERLRLLGELNTAQEKLIDSGTSWGSTLSAIVKSYDDGMSGLTQYLSNLTMFEEQIRKFYAGATGAAKEAVDNMIAMIEKLIATAGSRPQSQTTGNPMLDDLNRQLKG